MIETKIIKAVFGATKSIITQSRYRYDYGQIIEVSGITLPESFEARFSNAPTGESVRVLGQNQRVAVPDNLMRTGKSVWCYITVHDAVTDGRTMYTIRIPIKDATERTDAEPTPVQQDIISQAIAALNSAVEQTAQDVESADASAQSAKADADRAETARDTAEGYVDDVQNYAQQAQASANSAASSATSSASSASQARQIKIDIESMVDEAQSAAGASAQFALESAQSASQASVSASSASRSAETASTKASEASASAQTASAKASEASGYASTASQKATEASQSASQALSYKTDAESAKTASQTAQGLAESARDTAVQAKTDAESARDDAETARDEAQQAVASISGALDDKAPVITDTASGSIASFSDGANDLPLKSLIVDINPIQDLFHGDPSPENLCPISGWTEVNVNHSDADTSNPTTITIQLGQTVYGGKLDVLSGVLTVDRLFATKKWGQMTSVYAGNTHRTKNFILDANVLKGGQNSITNITATYIEATTTQSTHYYIGSDFKTVYVTLPNDTNTDTDIQVCGTLVEPIEIQLTPNQINSLYGVNNIWADSGDTEVEYRADVKLYINKKIAEAVSALS